MDKSGYNSLQVASKDTKFGYIVNRDEIKPYSSPTCLFNKNG